MCFMKPPKIDMPAPAAVVPPPPPLAEEVQGVDFGGADKSKDEGSGRKTLTVKRDSKVKSRMASRQTRGVINKNSAVDTKSS